MKHLLASTAIVIATSTAAFAEAHSTSPFAASPEGPVYYSSELVGARLYVSENEAGEALEARAEWDDVGEIGDIIVGKDGEVKHVLADIGGFLGIGEKRIAISMDALEFVSDGADADEYFIVLAGSRDALENAPTFDRTVENMEQQAEATMNEAEAETEEMVAEADAEMEQAEQKIEQTAADMNAETDERVDQMASSDADRPRFAPPMIEREGYEMAAMDSLTTEEVTGTRVYDANDEWIGEVNSLILADSGKLSHAIIDVGGFLGLGEKQVSLSMEELTIQRGAGGLRVYLDATEAQLNQMPEWQG